ncbi:hypothetical protein BaRGS_00016063 [Batillaria attramentaria]|uniref:Uncharacterized protein n=1 Tax=Batillaria attramentaria TaxID=370345 RepID=A0ABD0KZS8_9CAEN
MWSTHQPDKRPLKGVTVKGVSHYSNGHTVMSLVGRPRSRDRHFLAVSGCRQKWHIFCFFSLFLPRLSMMHDTAKTDCFLLFLCAGGKDWRTQSAISKRDIEKPTYRYERPSGLTSKDSLETSVKLRERWCISSSEI